MDLRKFIRDIPNFPKKGILFRDITPLLKDKEAFRHATELLCNFFAPKKPDYVLSVEARGFIIGSAVAYRLNCGFIPARKPKKLPYKTICVKYQLEYGEDEISIHEDAIGEGSKVAVIDDVLATGGTAKALIELVEKSKGKVVGLGFLVELVGLKGREKFFGYEVYSILKLT